MGSSTTPPEPCLQLQLTCRPSLLDRKQLQSRHSLLVENQPSLAVETPEEDWRCMAQRYDLVVPDAWVIYTAVPRRMDGFQL